MIHLAITGGTGFVGQTLLDMVGLDHADSLAVKALARRIPAPRTGVEWIKGDLHDRAALARLVDGVQAVIHVAGVVNAPDVAEFDRANVDGTVALMEACKAAGVSRFIFVSSLSAREPTLSRYGASKARAEEAVKASGLDWTIIRPPAIYGPRDREMFELFRAASHGVVPVPAGGRASLIHVKDLARLLLALVEVEGANAVFEPDDGTPDGWRNEDMARALGEAVRRKVRVIPLPPFVLRLGAVLDTLLRGRKAKLTFDRVGYMVHPDWVCSPAAAPPSQIWKPEISTQEGFAATASWYRGARWIT